MSSAHQAATAERQVWLDYAKAIGIILVVFGHASRSVGRTPGLVWSEGLVLADGLIYSFHMALFFVLAGYAATLSRVHDVRSLARSLWWGIALPYLLWSAAWIGLKSALPGLVNQSLGAGALARIFWQPVEHFWFLYYLLAARIAWFLIVRLLGPQRLWGALAAMITAATLLLSLSEEVPHPAAIIVYAAYFGVGLVALPEIVKRVATWRTAYALGLGAVWLCVALGAITLGAGRPGVGFLQLAAALLGAGMVIAAAHRLPQPGRGALRWLALIGEASLVVYLLHLFFAVGVRVALRQMGLLDETLLLWGATVAGLVGPLFVYGLLIVANERTGRPVSRWLGLGPHARSAYLDSVPVLPRRAPVANS